MLAGQGVLGPQAERGCWCGATLQCWDPQGSLHYITNLTNIYDITLMCREENALKQPPEVPPAPPHPHAKMKRLVWSVAIASQHPWRREEVQDPGCWTTGQAGRRGLNSSNEWEVPRADRTFRQRRISKLWLWLVPHCTSYSLKGKEVDGLMERIPLEIWMVESVLIKGHKSKRCSWCPLVHSHRKIRSLRVISPWQREAGM